MGWGKREEVTVACFNDSTQLYAFH